MNDETCFYLEGGGGGRWDRASSKRISCIGKQKFEQVIGYQKNSAQFKVTKISCHR